MTVYMVCEGRRLILPTDRTKEDHEKELTIACDVVSYPGKDSNTDTRVAYLRSFHHGSWKFRVVALDVDSGALLATTLVETLDEAQARLGRELRDQGLIAAKRED